MSIYSTVFHTYCLKKTSLSTWKYKTCCQVPSTTCQSKCMCKHKSIWKKQPQCEQGRNARSDVKQEFLKFWKIFAFSDWKCCLSVDKTPKRTEKATFPYYVTALLQFFVWPTVQIPKDCLFTIINDIKIVFFSSTNQWLILLTLYTFLMSFCLPSNTFSKCAPAGEEMLSHLKNFCFHKKAAFNWLLKSRFIQSSRPSWTPHKHKRDRSPTQTPVFMVGTAKL